jgi:hypothetical protein
MHYTSDSLILLFLLQRTNQNGTWLFKNQRTAQTQTGFAVCTTEEEKFGGPV